MYAYKSEKDQDSPKCIHNHLSPFLDSVCLYAPFGESCRCGFGRALFMSKDPAILFYTSDFLTGTLTMTDEHVGMYIRLLCLQHQKGKLSEKDMLFICKTYVADVFCKFTQCQDGTYVNDRLQKEAIRRQEYSLSRSKNRLSTKSYVEHMETETETEDINIKAFNKKEAFEKAWNRYPKKDGKKQALKHFLSSVKSEHDLIRIERALGHYLSSARVQNGFVKNGSTFFNGWEDWVEYEEKVCPECKGKGKFVSTTGYEIICECPVGKGKS